jgi:hypothetical protein
MRREQFLTPEGTTQLSGICHLWTDFSTVFKVLLVDSVVMIRRILDQSVKVKVTQYPARPN